jgi:HAD superfamily hydrolase (TIGR01509 family)
MGGVLVERDRDRHRRRWCELLQIDPDRLADAVTRAIGPGWAGGRTPRMICAALASELGIGSRDAAQLLDDLHRDERLSPPLMDVVDAVRPAIKVAVLANNGPEVRRIWNLVHDLHRRVDLVVISGEERISKPEPAIYELVARRLDTAPPACVFVDDSRANVDGAAAVGMQTIHHESAECTARSLFGLIEARRRQA